MNETTRKNLVWGFTIMFFFFPREVYPAIDGKGLRDQKKPHCTQNQLDSVQLGVGENHMIK